MRYSPTMKLNFLAVVLTAATLISCANPQVGQKPTTAAVTTSNEATRQRVRVARSKIKEAQQHEAKGATALEKADNLLNQMLKK